MSVLLDFILILTQIAMDPNATQPPHNSTSHQVKMKLLSFHENNRPAYYGTWSKKSGVVGGRKPFCKDSVLDYEVVY